MQLRLPWLGERLPLMALAGWDCGVGTCAYTVLYRLRMGSWWGEEWQALLLLRFKVNKLHGVFNAGR